MPTDTTFRLSTYLALAAACAALGCAESEYLPEVGAFAAVVVVGLGVIYRLETRVELLSIPAANTLGGTIAFAGAAWAGFRVIRELQTNEHADLGWPQFLVALMSPVLMAGVSVKLLRRAKHAGDYWYLHAAGLAAVALAGAMSRTPLVLALGGAYAAAAVWSLSEFYLRRADGTVAPIPGRGPARPRPVAVAFGSRPGRVRRTLGWAATTAAVAGLVFLFTPRSSFGRLDFGNPRMEVGYGADQTTDLNRTGELEENHELAFEVTADAGGVAKTDLGANQRWRGKILVSYAGGSWRRDGAPKRPEITGRAVRRDAWVPPDLGPGRYRLTFDVPVKLRAHLLADPVAWAAGRPPPVADLPPSGPPQPWYPLPDGSFVSLSSSRSSALTTRYVQYTRAFADPDLGPGFTIRPSPSGESVGDALLDNPVPAVRNYAGQLLAMLVREQRLPAAAAAREPVRLRVADEHHEAVARAFCRHLAESPEFTYTTALRRGNAAVDPVEDFLLTTRAGHCERYATALALMLRSQGIPAVLVLGFKGCDHVGGGRYEVRQDNAHAWVEALVARPDRDPAGPWHWLALDPTPSAAAAEAADATEGTGWGARTAGAVRDEVSQFFWRSTPDQRRQAVADAVAVVVRPGPVVALLALVAFAFLGRSAKRRIARRRTEYASEPARWFGQLLTALAARGFTPAPGETPREFADATAASLRDRAATAAAAGVPIEWAAAYYEVRFGGTDIDPAERARLAGRLTELKAALAAAGGSR